MKAWAIDVEMLDFAIGLSRRVVRLREHINRNIDRQISVETLASLRSGTLWLRSSNRSE